ncbi:MAG: hypothetical protein QGH34_02180 [Candidatus Woesearchaeota archaeon]|jgi:hypothetical protein|nr:hypothetical protein [Candidatus Woesearchaeota archaeon]
MRKTNLKRGQAALEFLTTYGWAFLVILIMMSALAYFGVLNPTKLLPERCNFGAEISCNKDFMLVKKSNEGTIIMRFSNGVGTHITVTAVEVVSDLNVGTCTAKIGDTTPAEPTNDHPISWPSGETITLTVDCDTGTNLIENEKVKFNMEIDYFPSSAGPVYEKTVFGDIFATIQ